MSSKNNKTKTTPATPATSASSFHPGWGQCADQLVALVTRS